MTASPAVPENGAAGRSTVIAEEGHFTVVEPAFPEWLTSPACYAKSGWIHMIMGNALFRFLINQRFVCK